MTLPTRRYALRVYPRIWRYRALEAWRRLWQQ